MSTIAEPSVSDVGVLALEISEKDVSTARRCNGAHCPTANALQRRFKDASFVWAEADTSRKIEWAGIYASVTFYENSADLSAMIEAYDNGDDFVPGLYFLTPLKSS